MSSSSSSAGGGIGFTSALGLLFIGLKLGGVIDWSWWWVLAPFWGVGAIVIAMVVVIFGIALIGEEATNWGRKGR